MKIRVETERLYLRDFEKADAKDLFKMDSNPLVHRYLGKRPITKLKQAEETIDWLLLQYRENGIGRWACCLKEKDEFIGWCGLKVESQFRSFTYHDLGYRFAPEFWGKGFGFESAKACKDYAFEILKWPKLNGTAEIENMASNKILQKLGFEQTEQFTHEGVLCNWYQFYWLSN